jgi:hypothetical protein
MADKVEAAEITLYKSMLKTIKDRITSCGRIERYNPLTAKWLHINPGLSINISPRKIMPNIFGQ